MTTKNTLRTKLRSTLLGLALVGAASLMTGTEASANRDQCLRDGGRPAAEVKVGRQSIAWVGPQRRDYVQTVKVRYWKKGWFPIAYGGRGAFYEEQPPHYTRWSKGNWTTEKYQISRNKGAKKKIEPTGHHYKGNICVHEIGDQIVWHDGASEPLVGRFITHPWAAGVSYKDVFRRPGIQHDHCYHHGMATYGHNKKYCDDEMLTNMKAECNFRWPGSGFRDTTLRWHCRRQADKFYAGLRANIPFTGIPFSRSAWRNTNTKVRYNDRALLPGTYRLTDGTIISAEKDGRWCKYLRGGYELAGKPKYRQLTSSEVPSTMEYKGGRPCPGSKWNVHSLNTPSIPRRR